MVNAMEINTKEELISCFENSGDCIVTENIDSDGETLQIVSNNEINLDLNGFKLTGIYFLLKEGNLNIKTSKENGTIETTNKTAIEVKNGKLIIDSGTFIGANHAVYVGGGNATVVINNGTFIGKGFEGNDIGTNGLASYSQNANITINNGIFKALQKSDHYSASGISIDYSNIIINNGIFEGLEYGFKSSGAKITINDGTFKGDRSGIWVANNITFTSSVNQNFLEINNGIFEGSWAARIGGKNSNTINGGTFNGFGAGLNIECVNLASDDCKDGVVLKGGRYTYKDQTDSTTVTYPSAAIILNSDLNDSVYISDLIPDEYKISNNEFLSLHNINYGFFHCTSTKEIVIEKINNNSTSNENVNSNLTSANNDEVIENPKTGNTMLFVVIGALLIAIIIIVINVRKFNYFKDTQ